MPITPRPRLKPPIGRPKPRPSPWMPITPRPRLKPPIGRPTPRPRPKPRPSPWMPIKPRPKPRPRKPQQLRPLSKRRKR